MKLLTFILKLFEKLLLKGMRSIIEENKLIPLHQFGFREVHRITDIIETSLTEKVARHIP